MNNLIFGIITISICTFLCYSSWINFKIGKDNIALFLLLLSGLLLRFYLSADFQLHEWDERYHALVAKNMIESPFKPMLYKNPVLPYNYQNWIENHVWLHKQPLPFWFMAASLLLFGINEIALRIPSIMLSTIIILLIFHVAKYLFNRRVAFISAFLISINGLIIELAAGKVATDHVDIFFLFFVLLSIFFTVKFIQTKKIIFNLLIGVSVGLAILSKWLPALVVFPVYLAFIIDSRKFTFKEIIRNLFISIITCIVVFLPWQIYIANAFPLEAISERNFNYRHITEVLENHSHPLFYYFNNIRIIYGELIYIPCIWFFFQNIQAQKN